VIRRASDLSKTVAPFEFPAGLCFRVQHLTTTHMASQLNSYDIGLDPVLPDRVF